MLFRSQEEKFREPIKLKSLLLKPSFQQPISRQVLRIPETRLPPQFQYLKPFAIKEIELNLEKLNPLLADSAVEIIESNGPNQQIIVKGRMGTKLTNIVLTEEEIAKVIQTFSEKAKIPIDEGVTKIALGRFILSAIISKEAGSRFVIKKLLPSIVPAVPKNPKDFGYMMPKR